MADYDLITIEEYKNYIEDVGSEHDVIYQELITRASEFIEEYTRRKIKTRTFTHERYDGNDKDYLFIENYPVTAIERISIGTLDAIKIYYDSDTVYNAYAKVSTTGVTLVVDGTAGSELAFSTYTTLLDMATAINGQTGWTGSVAISDYNSWPSTLIYPQQNVYAVQAYGYLKVPDEPIYDYKIDATRGMIYYSTGFDSGVQNVFITYNAGYSNAPEVLKMFCCELVKQKFDQSNLDLNLKSEKMGDYSYTKADLEGLPKDILMEVDLYKRPIV